MFTVKSQHAVDLPPHNVGVVSISTCMTPWILIVSVWTSVEGTQEHARWEFTDLMLCVERSQTIIADPTTAGLDNTDYVTATCVPQI